MKRLGLALLSILCLGVVLAQAQQVTMPLDQGAFACAYNSALPTVASGNYGLIQCDSAGRLITTASGSVPSSATPTYTNVASAAVDTPLLALNASRKPNSTIVNDSTAILCIKLALNGSSATSYYVAVDGKTTVPGIFQIPDNYTGAISGTWAAANGFARVTEMQ